MFKFQLQKRFTTPILKELEDYGVNFKEKEVHYLGYNPLNFNLCVTNNYKVLDL